MGTEPDREWDVAIVGAGPAGATAAIHLAARGHEVLLLDRRRFPRDKTCGDGLLPDAIRCLQRANVWDEVRPQAFHSGISRFFSPSGVEFDIAAACSTIEREVLDAVLVREAQRRGAALHQAHVQGLVAAPGGGMHLRIAGHAGAVRARFTVVATGADVSLLEPLGMVRRPEPSAFAVRRYLESAVPLDHLVLAYDRATLPGYGWIFPLGGGRYNIGCGIFGGVAKGATNTRELFDRFIQHFPLASRMVRQGEFVSPLRGARLRCGLSGTDPLGSGPVLAIGDSIGATFPFSGEGIGKAMETGELAATAIDGALNGEASAIDTFPQAIERLRPRYLGYGIAERWLSHPWLTDFLVRRARRSSFFREALSGIVAETVDPRAVFSVRGVLASLWR